MFYKYVISQKSWYGRDWYAEIEYFKQDFISFCLSINILLTYSPLQKSLHAKLTNILIDANVKLIAMKIVFQWIISKISGEIDIPKSYKVRYYISYGRVKSTYVWS